MIWRGGRVAEGAPLLREYTRNRIVGSNPTLSAKNNYFYLMKRSYSCKKECLKKTACYLIPIS